ncbi:MAG TPA: hypothetical protein VGI75_15505, partial [Pirellulales bacterium]
WPSSQADRLSPETLPTGVPNSAALPMGQQETDSAPALAAAESGIRSLLCRFVSNDWIDRRLRDPP